ncbi:MAG: hypothetical protein H6Q90_1299 [Deltaproteobacteria bacterium]|nr:hypothetical protein [Deltaproteobacteria bacterium]
MFAGVLLVTAAAASWGMWSLFLRPIGLPATVTTPFLYAVMGLGALPIALRGKHLQGPAVWDRKTVALVITQAAMDAGNTGALFGAMAHTTVAIAVLTHYLGPLLVAIAAPWIEGTVVRGAWAATLVALAGLVLLVAPWSAPPTGVFVGVTLGLISAVCFAGSTFTMRSLTARIGPWGVASYPSMIVAVAMAPFAIGHLGEFTAKTLGLMLLGSLLLGLAAGVAYASGLHRIGSARTAVLSFIDPVVAVIVGVVAWGEELRVLAVVGMLLVIGAGVHVARSTR